MGFEVGGSAVRLEFAEGTLLAGANVKCSLDVGLSEYLDLLRELDEMKTAAPDDTQQLVSAYARFGDMALREWDLTWRGAEVPATGAGLVTLPLAVIIAVFSAWTDAVKGESPNSSGASPSGDTSEQAPSEATAA